MLTFSSNSDMALPPTFYRSISFMSSRLFPFIPMGPWPPQDSPPVSGLLQFLLTNSCFTSVQFKIKATHQSNAGEPHDALSLFQSPSPTCTSVDHISGHTSKLFIWNHFISNLRCCLSLAWPLPPVLPPRLQSASEHRTPAWAPAATPCLFSNLHSSTMHSPAPWSLGFQALTIVKIWISLIILWWRKGNHIIMQTGSPKGSTLCLPQKLI